MLAAENVGHVVGQSEMRATPHAVAVAGAPNLTGCGMPWRAAQMALFKPSTCRDNLHFNEQSLKKGSKYLSVL